MLLCKDRRGGEKDDLLPTHERLEGRAQGNLRLAEPDISAKKPVHGPPRLHVLLDLRDRTQLVGRLAVGEALLQFPLPRRVGTEGMSLSRLAFGLQFQQATGVEEDRLLRRLAGLGPFLITERREIRGMLPDADIARDLPRLIDRNEKTGIVGKLKRQHLPLASVCRGKFLQSEVTPDAVLRMDDEIPFGELGEINRGARGPLTLPAQMETAQALTGGTAEELRIRENGELSLRKAEAARNSPDPNLRKRLHLPVTSREGEFAETFPLRLCRAHQHDTPPLLPPGR